MDLITELQKDLDSGFTKSDLERCIGLPKNSLSGIMAGSRNISKKAKLKIEHFLNNPKPNPLDLTKTNKIVETVKFVANVPEKIALKGDAELINQEIWAKIKEIESEPVPAIRNTTIGKKSFQIEQNKKISELKKQLINL